MGTNALRILGLGGSLLLAGMVSGCGSSSRSTSAPATSGTPQTTASVQRRVISADDASAKSASLQLSDFPTGWTSSPDTSTDDATLDKRLAKCLGSGTAIVPEPPASYDSPNFSDSDNITASSTVNYRATADEQVSAFDLFSNPKIPHCLATAVSAAISSEMKHPSDPKDTLPAEATIGATTVSPMSFPKFGDKSAAYQLKLPITFGGLNVSMYLDMVYAIKGRAAAVLMFEAFARPFSSSQEQHYMDLVVGRLTNTGSR